MGRENVPRRGSFIFVSNHQSYLDPILLGTSIRRGLYYMARENLFHRPLSDWIMRGVHAFPVKRGKGDLGAIRSCLNILKKGGPVVIFPEGTRSKDYNLKKGKPGVGFIVSKAAVPVVPVFIDGSFSALSRGIKTLKRFPVSVYIGEPVRFDAVLLRKTDKESYQKISDEIMSRIAELKKHYGSGKA